MKLCLKCNKLIKLENFYNRKGESDGKHRYCKECMTKENYTYYHDIRKHTSKLYYKKYRDSNKDYMKLYRSIYYPKNKLILFEKEKIRLRKDINFKLIKNLRNNILKKLKSNKSQSSIKYLGCSIPKYKLYLESFFEKEMNWSNHGLIWEIDHVIPISNFNLEREEEQFEAFNYLNTQPLFKTTKIAKDFGYQNYIGNRDKKKVF